MERYSTPSSVGVEENYRKMHSTKAVLIAETEWDFQQLVARTDLNKVNITVFYTNNYYRKSFRKSKLLRLFKFLVILLKTYILKFFGNNITIFVSDLNFEGQFICKIPNLVDFIFIPNVIVWNQNEKRQRMLAPYAKAKRIVFSDQISHYLCYAKTETGLAMLDSLTELSTVRSRLFLVILPSVFSHEHTKKLAEEIINELLSLANEIDKLGFKVFVAAHPREYAQQARLIEEKCNAKPFNSKVHSSDEIVYISFYSSVSLNKKYGPGLGYWISFSEDVDMDAGYQMLRSFAISKQDFINAI